MGIYKDNIITSLLSQNLPVLKGDSLNSVKVSDSVSGESTPIITAINGNPWYNLYKNGVSQSGNLTWNSAPNFPIGLSGGAFTYVIIDNKIYIINLYHGGTFTQPVYEATISQDGIIGSFTSIRNITYDGSANQIVGGTLIYTKYCIYHFGHHRYGSSSYVPVLLRMDLINDVPSFNFVTDVLSHPVPAENNAVILFNGYVYAAGGNDYYEGSGAGYSKNTVAFSKVGEDGKLLTFGTTTSLPVSQTRARFFNVGYTLYLVSGHDNSPSTIPLLTIYKVEIAEDTHEITGYTNISNPLPAGIARNIVVTRDCVYIFSSGGNIYKATINDDETFGTLALSGTCNVTNSLIIPTSSRIYNGPSDNKLMYYSDFSGGKNDYKDDVYSIYIPPYESGSSIWYALSKDGLTYQIYTGSAWKPIATSDPAVHGFTGESVPYYWDSDTLEWVYSKSSMQGAISNALKYEDNRMTKTILNSLSSFSSVFDTDTGEIYLAVSMFSYGEEKPEVSNIALNNKGYWISDQYDLDDYVTTVTAATVKIGYALPVGVVGYADALKIYCMRSDQGTWVECVDGVVSNLPNGLSTAGISVRFRVVWDSSVWVNIESVSIDFTLK